MSPMKRTSFGFRKEITVFQYERGLLYRDGVMERVLEPGRYDFARSERVEVAKVSLREMSHIVPGQGLLTADHIEVRVTLVAQYRVVDPTLALQAVENYVEQLHQNCNWPSGRDRGPTVDKLLEDRTRSGRAVPPVR